MSCNCTSNTLVREFTAIKGATLVIAGSMTAGGIAMNLAGYVFTIEFFSDSSHSTPSLSPMNAVISGSAYTFTITLPSTKGTHYYRVKEIDSLARLNPEALRSGKITITD